DDPIDRMAIERLVAPIEQLHLDFARDLPSFLELHGRQQYDFFISDFFVGIDTGLQVAALVHPHSVIFLTGLQREELLIDQLPENVIGIFSKPLEFDELLLILDGISTQLDRHDGDLTQDLKAVQTLEYLVQHSPKVKAEVLTIFKQTLESSLPELRRLLQEQEFQQISPIAHRLKSLFRTLGLQRLLQQAVQLEIQCKSLVPASQLGASVQEWIVNMEEVLLKSKRTGAT
ncbi:MAG: response regulator, partial [Phaeodactylibacter sp.]|nr:response regulator [Phaeodactylibacter sp.]